MPRVVKDDRTHEQMLRELKRAPIVSYDVETRSDEGDNREDWHPSSRIVCASFTLAADLDTELETWLLPLSHPAGPWSSDARPDRDQGWKGILRHACEAMAETKLIAQNGKFDLRWTHSMTGVALEDRLWFDPMAASYALDETQPKGLKILAPQYLGVPRWDDVDLRNAEKVPWKQLALYNARDTIYTYRLAKPMLEELKEDSRTARIYHFVLMPITRKLVKIERTGLRPDPETVAERIISEREAVEDSEEHLLKYVEKFMGEVDLEDINWHPSSKFFRVFMHKSGAPVYEHTKNGIPSWNASVMKRLANDGAEYVQYLLAFREHQKNLSFLEAWEKYAEADGRIHPTFNPMRYIDITGQEKGTITGRLSSSNPNAQQIPRRLKEVFGGEDGWLFCEADWAQIELRIAAWVFKIDSMMGAFERGDDLHLIMAAEVDINATLRAAEMLLVRLGLPTDRSGAKILLDLWKRAGQGGQSEEIVQPGRANGEDTESGSRVGRRSTRGEESLLEGWSESSSLPPTPEEIMRGLRGEIEWEWNYLGRSSHRPRSGKQSSLKPKDAVQIVSSLDAPSLEALTGEPWGQLRQKAKVINFGYLYGMGAGGFVNYAYNAYGIDVDIMEAQRLRQAFFRRWPEIQAGWDRVIELARMKGYAVSPLGRLRRVPEITSPNEYERSRAERQAVNSVVQSTASDLMLLSIIDLEPALDPEKARIVGTVHDSLLFEVRKDAAQEVLTQVANVMLYPGIKRRFGAELTVPLSVEFKIGRRWADRNAKTLKVGG